MARGIIGLLGLVLTASIFWAGSKADIFKSFGLITADPWGVVTLIDLYLGFVIAAFIIFVAEGRRAAALLWIIPIFFLGNVVVALWFVLRGGRWLATASRQP